MTRINEHIFNRFPQQMTVKSDKNIAHFNWIGEHISSPQNRLIMGVTALASQPFLDLYNNDVDKKTRVMACAKTLAKILVGTTVGVIIRSSAISLARRGCNIPEASKALKKMATIFTPTGVTDKKLIDAHSKTIGTVLGTGAGVITNFVIDMPLTKLLTNVFIDKFQENDKNKNINSKGGQ